MVILSITCADILSIGTYPRLVLWPCCSCAVHVPCLTDGRKANAYVVL